MQKIQLMSLIMGACSLGTGCYAQSFNQGTWTFTYNRGSHTIDISQDGQVYIKGGYAECRYEDGARQHTISSTDGRLASFTKRAVTDCFGRGMSYTYTFTKDGGSLIQNFRFYDNLPYFLVHCSVTDKGKAVKSNYMVPLRTRTAVSFLSRDLNNRVLYVPWDNDGYSRYRADYMKGTTISNNATAIYNADSRKGLIIGAVDHNQWKNAIEVGSSDYHQMDSLMLLSGYTAYDTRDTISAKVVMPHGKVAGDTVSSSRFVVGLFDDWRIGMETFGQACTKVAPRRICDNGNFYGWNSWGVQQTHITFDGVMDVIHFINSNLKPKGFYDKKGQVLISLDSWYSNLNDTQLQQFVDTCKKYNMIPGVYACPFCDWGKNGNAPVQGSRYTYKDIWLKRNGQCINMVNAYAIDPTHPGTKIAFKFWLDKLKRIGIKYLKLDFMDHGAMEADSWYDKNVTTGMQAYNEGLEFIRKQCGNDFIIDLSISPLFPYQYAECRRISCDAYSNIDNTNYVMNNTTFGWWLDQFYINDPDNLVLKSLYHNGQETEGENRARLTSGVATGMYLCSDNFSDRVSQGYPAASRERALKFVTNQDVNAIPRTCTSFRPVTGAPQKKDDAENLMIGESEDYYYLAAINYNTVLTPISGSLSFDRLGIDPASVDSVKELWTGADVNVTSEGFSYYVPAKDARIYRIHKKTNTTGVTALMSDENNVNFKRDGNDLIISANQGIIASRALDLSGQEVHACSYSTPRRDTTLSSLNSGIYLVEVTTADQQHSVRKYMMR